MRVKELYSKQIYDGNGYYFDSTSDVMIDIQPGKAIIIGVTTPTLLPKKKMIPYSSIKAIGDIIILKD